MLHINKSDTRSMPVLRQEEASGFGGSRKQASSVAARGVEITSLKPDVGGALGKFLVGNPCSSTDRVLNRSKASAPAGDEWTRHAQCTHIAARRQ